MYAAAMPQTTIPIPVRAFPGALDIEAFAAQLAAIDFGVPLVSCTIGNFMSKNPATPEAVIVFSDRPAPAAIELLLAAVQAYQAPADPPPAPAP